MTNPYIILLTFYSGKLWHSDKPFPVKPKTNASILEDKYLLEVRSWLSTAYEVVNPEQAAVYYHEDLECWKTGSPNYKTLLDGDQITLPEGYGIKIVMSEGWQPTYNNPDNSGCEQPAEPIGVSITLPEKTDTGERYYNGTPEGSKTFPIGRTGHGFEPSESQEDQRELWYDVGHVVNSHRNGTDMVEELMKKFHITRRK